MPLFYALIHLSAAAQWGRIHRVQFSNLAQVPVFCLLSCFASYV